MNCKTIHALITLPCRLVWECDYMFYLCHELKYHHENIVNVVYIYSKAFNLIMVKSNK